MDTDVTAPQEPQEPAGATETAEPVSEGGGLRTQLEAALAENRELKGEKRDGIIQGLGLQTDKGLGLALAEQFDRGEIGLDAIASTATEKYGHIVPETAPPAHPQQQQIQQGQQQLDQVNAQAGSIPQPTVHDQIAQAEAEGRWQDAMALKTGIAANMRS